MWIHNHYRYRHFLRHFHSCLSFVFSSSSLTLCLLSPIPSLSQTKQTTNFFTVLDHMYTLYRIVHSSPIWTLFFSLPHLRLFCCSARLHSDSFILQKWSQKWIYIYTQTHFMVKFIFGSVQCDAMRCDTEQWTVNSVQAQTHKTRMELILVAKDYRIN